MTGDTPLGTGREFDAIRAMLRQWGSLAQGVGDDAAVIDVPRGERLVVSTDTSVEHVHFRRAWLSASEIGYRATMAALSDLAAMGATALGVLVAMTVPAEWLGEMGGLAGGVGDAARDAGTTILGGDTTSGAALSLTVTVLGAAVEPLTRAGARPGDALFVTGQLGGPIRALRAFESGGTPMPADRARFAHPTARLREGRWLAAHRATAAVDISDGLLADATHLAAASGTRLRIDVDRLPLVAGASANDGAASGEEYELLVAGPRGLDAAAFARETGTSLTRIGAVEARGTPAVHAVRDGRRVDLPGGYDHFSR